MREMFAEPMVHDHHGRGRSRDGTAQLKAVDLCDVALYMMLVSPRFGLSSAQATSILTSTLQSAQDDDIDCVTV